MTAALVKGEPWQAQAACAGRNPHWWESDGKEYVEAAKWICEPCPVRQLCLDHTMRMESPSVARHGTAGGLAAAERKALYRRRGREQRLATNRGSGIPLTPEEHQARVDAYHATGSDGEAAESLGMKERSFHWWRTHKTDLKAKGKRGPKPRTA